MTDYVSMSQVTKKLRKVDDSVKKLLKYLSARITAYFSDLHKSAARDTADLEKKADRNRNDIKVTHD